jgi:type IV pilus assembly protein PilO
MALKDSFANIPKNQKILLIVLVFLAVVAAYYFVVDKGMTAERKSLEQKRDVLRGELNEKKILAANLDRLKSEIALLESQLAQALLVLPEEKEIPKLLVNINSLGLKAGVDFLLFRPGTLVNRDFYGEFPVQMKVQGTYHALGLFFDMLSKMPRIVNASDIKIFPLPESKGKEVQKGRDTIVSEFTATTFTFAGAKGGKASGSGKAS